jgi:hypothetical protein
MSSKQNFQLLDALNIPHDGEFTLPDLSEPSPPEDASSEEFKENIPQMSQDKLCEIVVCFRYLGLMQEDAVLAMEELAARRANGDQFNFEDRIVELTKDLPMINIDINKMLKSFRM